MIEIKNELTPEQQEEIIRKELEKRHPSFFGLHFIFKKMPSFKLINLNKGIILMVKKPDYSICSS